MPQPGFLVAAHVELPRGLRDPLAISAVDHGHREAEPICRGPQEAGEVLQGLDAENVSLRADGPAERGCVAADVGLDGDGDRAWLDEPWQLVDIPLTVREEAAPRAHEPYVGWQELAQTPFVQLRAQRAGLYAMLAS